MLGLSLIGKSSMHSSKVWVASLKRTEKKAMIYNSMYPSARLAKAGANDIVYVRVAFVAQRLMELDVDNCCGASHSERASARAHSRNDRRDRTGETRTGTMPLRTPKLGFGGTSLLSWNSDAPPRRPWRRLFRQPRSRASRAARSMIWSRPRI